MVPPYPFSGTIRLQDTDLAVLKRLALEWRVPVRVDGTLQTTASFKGSASPFQFEIQANLKAPKLRIQNIPTQNLVATASYRDGVVEYHAGGQTLGGTFELQDKIATVAGNEKEINKGHVQIDNIQIHRLMEALNLGQGPQPFHGQIDVRLDLIHAAKNAWPTGSGRLRLTNVRYQDNLLASETASDLVLSNETLRLSNLYSDFGAGTIRAGLGLNLKHLHQSWFSMKLDNVEAAYLLGPWLGETVQGALQANIRGKFGAEWAGTADFELAHGKVMGLDITQWHLPMAFRYTPTEGRGEIIVPETSAQAGRGKLTGNLDLAWNHTMRVGGRLSMAGVDLQTLLRQAVGATNLGGGLVSGRFDFSGREMHSLNDLTGTISASLKQSQALKLPVLQQLSPFLGIQTDTTFNDGRLRARLERGFIHIVALALEGANVHVFAEGDISFQRRLDLDVTGGASVLGIGPARLVHLQVGGTLQSPTIRLLPLATITQATRLFLIRGLIPTRP